MLCQIQFIFFDYILIATIVAEWPATSNSGSGEANNDPDPGFEDDENKQNSHQSNGNCIYVMNTGDS